MVIRYLFENACNLSGPGVYISLGRNSRGKSPANNKLLYCGISSRDIGKRILEHREDKYNHLSNEWWVGRVIFPEENRIEYLEIVEWIIVYFSETEHNIRKTQYPPKNEIYLINEWYFPDGRRRVRNRGMIKLIADVLCWSNTTNLVREGNLTVWEH